MLLDAFRLDGRSAIVTGAGKGIGRTIALSFAEMGARVVCVARSEADIEKTAEEARSFGTEAIAVRCDVSSEEELENLVQKTADEFGGIDMVINNAGGGGQGYGPVDSVTMSQFRRFDAAQSVFGLYVDTSVHAPSSQKQHGICGKRLFGAELDGRQTCVGLCGCKGRHESDDPHPVL